MCRCPYCTATVPVSGKAGGPSTQARPDSPLSRPATPEVAVFDPSEPTAQVEHVDAAEQERSIPVAAPVMVQGLFAMALLGILLVLIVGGGLLLVMNLLEGKDGKGGPGNGGGNGELLNPFVTNPSRPAVGGRIPVTAPVIYVLPASTSMAQMINYASGITKASIRSLRTGKFSILLCGEKTDEFMADDYTPAGEAGIEAAAKFLVSAECRGASDIARGMAAAQARSPKTIVLLSRGGVDGMEDLAAQAKQRGILVVTIALDAGDDDRQSQADFATSAGGKSLSYTRGELAHYFEADAGE